MGSEDAGRDSSKQSSSPNKAYKQKEGDSNHWGIFLSGLVGATAATFALVRSQSLWKGCSFQTSIPEGALKWYNRRMLEKYEEEMERVERIRNMQSVFRERSKCKRSYKSWMENGPDAYHPRFQHDDWYWKADTSYGGRRANYWHPQRESISYPLSYHYAVLGLDRSGTKPYTQDEIKTAFRAKIKQFHPDKNRDDKEVEAKFKEVMISYKAIMQERKIMRV